MLLGILQMSLCIAVDSNILLISLSSSAKVIQSFQFRVMNNGVAVPVLYAEMGTDLQNLIQLKWGLNGIVVGASAIPGVGVVSGTYVPVVAVTMDSTVLAPTGDIHDGGDGTVVALGGSSPLGLQLEDIVLVTPQEDNPVHVIDSSSVKTCSVEWAEEHNVDPSLVSSPIFTGDQTVDDDVSIDPKGSAPPSPDSPPGMNSPPTIGNTPPSGASGGNITGLDVTGADEVPPTDTYSPPFDKVPGPPVDGAEETPIGAFSPPVTAGVGDDVGVGNEDENNFALEPPPSAPAEDSSSKSSTLVIGLASGGAALVFLAVSFALLALYRRRRARRKLTKTEQFCLATRKSIPMINEEDDTTDLRQLPLSSSTTTAPQFVSPLNHGRSLSGIWNNREMSATEASAMMAV
mmetsp:Transcript_12142/g.44297  ORF Transcript_12142/g.44297 Transcript_12142/m.44297 type:complete len:404 (-) Transcript_12142:98-1309(-)